MKIMLYCHAYLVIESFINLAFKSNLELMSSKIQVSRCEEKVFI